MGISRAPYHNLYKFITALVCVFASIVFSLSYAEDNVLEQFKQAQNENDVDQCVNKVNEIADDSISTAERLYKTGICYLCVGCDIELDNGGLFENQFSQELLVGNNYETAYKLMQQSADLGSRSGNYGLAVLLFSKNLDESKLTKDKIVVKEFESFKHSEQSQDMDEDGLNKMLAAIKKNIYSKQHDLDFSNEIHVRLLNSARDGYIPAQFALSEVYSSGIGIAPNKVHAYAWAATAVAQNPPFGSDRRDNYAVNLDSFEINEAESLAEQFMKDHTEIFERSSITVMR